MFLEDTGNRRDACLLRPRWPIHILIEADHLSTMDLSSIKAFLREVGRSKQAFL